MRLWELPERIHEVGLQAQLASHDPGLARLSDAQVVPRVCGVHLSSLGATLREHGRGSPRLSLGAGDDSSHAGFRRLRRKQGVALAPTEEGEIGGVGCHERQGALQSFRDAANMVARASIKYCPHLTA